VTGNRFAVRCRQQASLGVSCVSKGRASQNHSCSIGSSKLSKPLPELSIQCGVRCNQKSERHLLQEAADCCAVLLSCLLPRSPAPFCSSLNIRPVAAQRVALAAGQNGTVEPFQIFVEDDAAVAQRFCWVKMLDATVSVGARCTASAAAMKMAEITYEEVIPYGALQSNQVDGSQLLCHVMQDAMRQVQICSQGAGNMLLLLLMGPCACVCCSGAGD